jgi:hypothetical protein
MTAFLMTIFLSLPSNGAMSSDVPRPAERHIEQQPVQREKVDEVLFEHGQLVLRDWKLLMPNWKPKTTAFASNQPEVAHESSRS